VGGLTVHNGSIIERVGVAVDGERGLG
jgi:hypothetical protein